MNSSCYWLSICVSIYRDGNFGRINTRNDKITRTHEDHVSLRFPVDPKLYRSLIEPDFADNPHLTVRQGFLRWYFLTFREHLA
jgi:hypothetical protein